MFWSYIRFIIFILSFSLLSATDLNTTPERGFEYFIREVELDANISHAMQLEKIQEFKNNSHSLSPEVAHRLIQLLLDETRSRVYDICLNAELNPEEIDFVLTEYDTGIQNIQNMNVDMAWQLLFFVAELKIHRQYVFDFGMALACPRKQLLRHDLCKLCSIQIEGYARYFRGGKREEDRKAYLAAWEIHQLEEHHLESYRIRGFEGFSEEQLQNNMLESASDLLASTKQRGGGTLINYLINVFPKKNPHPRLIPYLEEALMEAQSLYENNPDGLFKGLPCWNNDVKIVFDRLKES